MKETSFKLADSLLFSGFVVEKPWYWWFGAEYRQKECFEILLVGGKHREVC